MKTFLIKTLIFLGIIKYGKRVCWCLAFFNCTISYSKFDIVKIFAFISVQTHRKTDRRLFQTFDFRLSSKKIQKVEIAKQF